MAETSPRIFVLFALAVTAEVATVASLFGFSDTHKGWVIASSTVATLLWVGGVSIIIRQRRSLVRLAPPVRRVPHMSEALALLPFESARVVYCLGSGTETYYSLLEPRMREGIIPRGTKLCIGFRTGDEAHKAKLTEYARKWPAAARRCGVDVEFYPVSDFDHSMRGVVLDSGNGAIGFYFRQNGETIGGDSEVLLVNRDTEAGSYLLDSFVRVFSCRIGTAAMNLGHT